MDSDRPRDIRNRAITLLFAVYGLRSTDVTNLELDGIDWERDRLSLWRQKQRVLQTYPLDASIGNALVRYLLLARPKCANRHLFLTLRAPFRPLSPGALYNFVSDGLTNIGVNSPHRGPHSLRHACATRLVTEGLSLKEIGDHLGHRSSFATRIYAKVDLPRLREVAAFDLGGVL
jgi:integrase